MSLTYLRPLPVLAAATWLTLVPNSAFAQKAEPSRIQFPRGSTGTVVKGVLRDRQDQEYAVSGVQGQTLELRLRSSPARSTALKVFDGNNTEIPLERVNGDGWMAPLRESREVVIIISRVPMTRGRSKFSLTIEIR